MYDDVTLTMPYIFDESPRLLQVSDAIAQCNSKERNYLGGIIAASVKENPESYAHLNYLYSELFVVGKPRPVGTVKKSKATTKPTFDKFIPINRRNVSM